jgi:small subunit ribosomal protein S8
MTMTDPIADMLTRVRNANHAYHDSVAMPYSTIKGRIAEILAQEGYVAGWHVDEPAEESGKGPETGPETDLETGPEKGPEKGRDKSIVGKQLVIELKYGPNRERTIAGVRRISKPGLRVYAKAGSLPRVLGGLGVAIISTSGGLLTDKQAAKRRVGGEVLAYVW